MIRFLVLSILAFFAGTRAFNIQPRIIDGFLSKAGQFPFYVFLDSEHGRLRCIADIRQVHSENPILQDHGLFCLLGILNRLESLISLGHMTFLSLI